MDPYTIVCVDTKVATNEVEIDDIYAKYIELGYEGGIVRLDGEYQQKRSNLLLKRKDFDDEEFEITRIEEGRGNWSGVAKRVFFRDHLNGNEECGAGLAGDRESAREILMNADEYIGKKVTIQFFKRTPDGVPRFPIAKALHKNERW
jgi:DNA ligase-1